MLKIRLFLVAMVAIGLPSFAQRPPRMVSPEVHPDRTVTFRLRGPEVHEVLLQPGWPAKPRSLVKGDDGVWSLTIGPMAPAIYDYKYKIDGVTNLDPHNPHVKPWLGGPGSLFEVPADTPAFYDLRDVPHGDLHIHYYPSSAVDRTRRVFIYTPPGYERHKKRYPVLFLFHGVGDNASTWTEIGRANLILDNLIAEGKAKPMVVVMPNGHPIPFGEIRQFSWRQNIELFEKDLVSDVLPLLESRYRVFRDRRHRAIAGLSMGGGQAVGIGLARTDLFAYLGAFSAYVPNAAADPTVKAFLANPKKANSDLKVLWIAIGEDDSLLKGQQAFDALLTAKGIHHSFRLTEGNHSWPVWRGYLHEFAPLLFRDGR